jgi:hypothetical protein
MIDAVISSEGTRIKLTMHPTPANPCTMDRLEGGLHGPNHVPQLDRAPKANLSYSPFSGGLILSSATIPMHQISHQIQRRSGLSELYLISRRRAFSPPPCHSNITPLGTLLSFRFWMSNDPAPFFAN